jgi:hypothetical protein
MTSSSNDTQQQLNLSLTVDKPLGKGFILAVAAHVVLFLLITVYLVIDPPRPDVQAVSLELIRLGFGSGPGSGGNLSLPGTPLKGPKPENPLEDASRQLTTPKKLDPAASYTPGAHVTPTSVTNAQRAKDSIAARGLKAIGDPNGSPTGTGLSGSGTGPGSGLGFGIDWGGGGNRIVLNKVLPQYPAGVNKNAQIKVKFNVMPDGRVGGMMPTQKGDPRMEQAALNALRMWRFNAIGTTSAQVGEITFSFKVD